MKPTLVVLAAGMGNRFGGLKQLTPVGPNRELLIDYSIYDARTAGFQKVVFVIREEIYSEFRARIGRKIEGEIETDYVFQSLDKGTSPHLIPSGRSKPWGTAHAVLVCKEKVHDPFVVINSDDYYGPEAYRQMITFFNRAEGRDSDYAMIAYRIGDTVSDHGSVSRGICQHDGTGRLIKIVEKTRIIKKDGVIFDVEASGRTILPSDQLISMNIWGLKVGFFEYLEESFAQFLTANCRDTRAEFYIPTVINQLLQGGRASVSILPTSDKWFGVTYQADLEAAVIQIGDLIEKGVYPREIYSH